MRDLITKDDWGGLLAMALVGGFGLAEIAVTVASAVAALAAAPGACATGAVVAGLFAVVALAAGVTLAWRDGRAYRDARRWMPGKIVAVHSEAGSVDVCIGAEVVSVPVSFEVERAPGSTVWVDGVLVPAVPATDYRTPAQNARLEPGATLKDERPRVRIDALRHAGFALIACVFGLASASSSAHELGMRMGWGVAACLVFVVVCAEAGVALALYAGLVVVGSIIAAAHKLGGAIGF